MEAHTYTHTYLRLLSDLNECNVGAVKLLGQTAAGVYRSDNANRG